jgi:hypothetical protein
MPDVWAYFQHALERTKQDAAARAKEKLDREAATTEGTIQYVVIMMRRLSCSVH